MDSVVIFAKAFAVFFAFACQGRFLPFTERYKQQVGQVPDAVQIFLHFLGGFHFVGCQVSDGRPVVFLVSARINP